MDNNEDTVPSPYLQLQHKSIITAQNTESEDDDSTNSHTDDQQTGRNFTLQPTSSDNSTDDTSDDSDGTMTDKNSNIHTDHHQPTTEQQQH